MSQPYANQEIQLLISQFDATDRATLEPVVSLVYGFYADKAAVFPKLRFWYAQRHLVDHLLRTKYKNADWKSEDLAQSLSQVLNNLDTLRSEANAEIARLEKQARAGRAPQVGTLTATETEGPVTPNSPDPNDPSYRGDPQRVSYFPR